MKRPTFVLLTVALVSSLTACGKTTSIPTPPNTPAEIATPASPIQTTLPLATAPASPSVTAPTAEPGRPTGVPETPAPHPTLDFQETFLTIPSGAQDAAAYLAAQVYDPNHSTIAAYSILSRAGIPIVSPFHGSIVNQPAMPNLADAYVYDFETPLVANGVAARRYWTLNDVAALGANLGLELNGQPLDGQLLANALANWTQAAVSDPNAPGEFLPLVVHELGLHHSPPQDLAVKLDTAQIQLDPLQFALIVASLTSRYGTAQTTFASRAPGLAFPALDEPCKTVSRTLDDPTGISKKYAKESFLDMLKDAIKETYGENVAGAFTTGKDYFDSAEDGIAVDLLLAGINLHVADDAKPAPQNAHYAHQIAAPENFYSYIATLRFDSPFPNQVLQCAGLAGIKLPDNGPLSGWQIRWRLEQDKHHVQPATSADSNKIERGFGGGGGGEITGEDGQSKLRVEVAVEPGCPNEPSCKKGNVKSGKVTGTACADTTDLPLKLSDLMPSLSGAFKFGKAAGKLIIDMLKRMTLPCVGDTVVITWHHPDTFLLTIDSTAILSTREGPVTQHIVWKVNVKFDDNWNVISGDGQVQTIELSLPQIPKCSFIAGSGVRMPVQVTGGKLTPTANIFPKFSLDDIELTFEPNWSQSIFTVRCPGGSGSGMMAILMDAWRIAYVGNGSAAHEGYTFTKWVTHDLSGKKAMQSSIDAGKGNVTLVTKMELVPQIGQ